MTLNGLNYHKNDRTEKNHGGLLNDLLEIEKDSKNKFAENARKQKELQEAMKLKKFVENGGVIEL